MRRIALWAAPVWVVLSGIHCIGNLTFKCDGQRSCGPGALCVGGACALTATNCPSGFRYDDSAPAAQRNACVPAAFDFAGIDLTVSDMGTVVEEDMARLGVDLSGVDFSGVDLTGIDFTMPEPGDMAMMPDACIPAGAEDCYNGVDDDCDGKADCADTDCTTDNECVPTPGSFTPGTLVTQVQSCPAGYSGAQSDISRGVSGAGACTGCTCTKKLNCLVTIQDYGAATCPGTPSGKGYDLTGTAEQLGTGTITYPETCTTGPPAQALNDMNITSGKIKVNTIAPVASCVPGGSPVKPALTYAEQTRFCPTTSIGGGCTPGNVCLRKTATKHCVLKTGTDPCPTGYAIEGGMSWYTGVDDSQRTCGAICSCTKTSTTMTTDCGTSKVRLGVNNGTCTTTSFDFNSGSDNCLTNQTGFKSGKVQMSGFTFTLPTCDVANTVTGSPMPSGETRLCCK